MRKHIIRCLAVFAALTFLLSAGKAAADAVPVGYLPGVTDAMTQAEFWTDRLDEPDELMASPEEIARINAAALATNGSNMHDLKNLPATFNGIARNESLKKGAAADAAYYLGWTYDASGKKMEQADYDLIIANCADPDAVETMPLRYGVAVNRALLLTFPYDGMILDDPADLECDYQSLVGIRVNEPVAVYTTSADGKFYQVFTSCCSGWVRVEDIALCRDRAEWLSAWDIPASRRLVFWGDKMYTDTSKTAPDTSRRMITMGTALERLDSLEPGQLVINRLPLHNYAVYLPVRNPDGSYSKKAALINAREKVSEDYLPLTPRNLAAVALASLGDAYGWGGTLDNEDCTSLNRSVYNCFGLDLPRNGNWQWPLAMPKVDAANLCSEEKELLLDQMPLGTLLTFPGHQMLYLGKVDGSYYVVSAVGNIMSPETGLRQRTRDVQLNTLSLKRANGLTWLEAVNRIYKPWQYQGEGEADLMPSLPWYHEGVSFCLEKKLIDCADGGYFQPGEAAVRAVIVEALWRMSEKPEPEGSGSGFPDVAEDASCAKAALWAQEQGVVNGVDGMFLPEGRLTREQLVAILYRFLKAENPGGGENLAAFTDADTISAYARDAMNWAVGKQVIQGRTDTTLCPKDVLTRAQLAVILQRSYGMYQDSLRAAEEAVNVADSGTDSEDGGTSATDAGTSATDTDTSAADDGASAVDDGTSAVDDDTSEADGGASEADGGASEADGGASEADADTSATDADTSAADDGTSTADDGTSEVDDGTSGLDADTSGDEIAESGNSGEPDAESAA